MKNKIEKVKMTVNMDVTIPQALALQAMFENWNILSSIGSSKEISFFCDGDGNFHPNCQITYDKKIPKLTEELFNDTIVKDNNGNRVFDYDAITWKLHNK